MSQQISCETASVNATDELEGDWKLSKVFLSDAYDSPCGWETKDHKDITLKIVQKDNKFEISGQSVVNSYFGAFTVTEENGIIMEGIGSTKMAGPDNLMNCETRYFNFLNDSKELKISETGELLVGNFRKPESHPRDGGTYLVFERLVKD